MANLPKIQVKNLFLGTMGWSYDFWPIYQGLTSSEYLSRYSEHFNSVEINSSFYRIPRKRTVERWFEDTPENFKFTAKFPRSISHAPKLVYESGKLDAFFKNIESLLKKKGPLLIQFPPKFKANNLESFIDLLNILPKRNRYAVEFRNQSWFNEETYKILRKYEVSLVQIQHPWQPTSKEITTNFVYIRWEGNRKSVNGEKGIIEIDRSEDNKKWAKLISEYLELSLEVYGFFSKFYSGYPPADINQILTMID